MKEAKILDGTKIVAFLEGLRAEFEVIVPRHENGDLLFGELDPARLEVNFAGRPLTPPKEYLFPQREKLFTFTARDGGEMEIEAYPNPAKRVLWGIRPCDLAGIKTLDAIFLSNYIDNYYQARRENTILMGLNCNKPCERGFCKSMQTGPFATSGFDLLFTDLGNKFLVETGSKAGRELAARRAPLFTAVSDEDKRKARELEKRSEQAFELSIDLDTVNHRLAKVWDDALWTEESETCILCGGCNFACPTCHCFNIEDVAGEQPQSSTRIRYWDSCQLGGFTQMAAENTRGTQAERLRQRIYHKFSYTPAKYEGAIGCTGCGRCGEVCPGEIDIINVMGRVAGK